MSNADSMRDSISEEKLNIIGKSMSKLKTKSNNMKEMPKPKHKNMLS